MMFGTATIILVGLHLASRVPYFKSQVAGKSRAKISRWLLSTIVLVWGGLLTLAVVGSQMLPGAGSDHRGMVIDLRHAAVVRPPR